MVFCCIAIVTIGVAYFIGLWLSQICSGPRRDRYHPSLLPAPPRALIAPGALPVYGHTFIFQKHGPTGVVCCQNNNNHIGNHNNNNSCHGGLLQPEMTEISCLPAGRFNQRLGKCFAVYIWGQWRVCIQGPELAKKLLEYDCNNENKLFLQDAFPWTPPVTLLGKSCLAFLEEEDAEQLKILLRQPVSHAIIVQYAPAFALLAEKCLHDIRAGMFSSKHKLNQQKRKVMKKKQSSSSSVRHDEGDSSHNDDLDESMLDIDMDHSFHVGEQDDATSVDVEAAGASFHAANNFANHHHKVKWEALRSYTFDLIDGPVLGLNKWNPPKQQQEQQHSEQTKGESTQQQPSSSQQQSSSQTKEKDDTSSKNNKINVKQKEQQQQRPLPTRERMLLWMERLKTGVDVIKITLGPEWMRIWLLNEYGRALNGRLHIHSLISKHVKSVQELVPHVEHRRGNPYFDPTTQMFPLLALQRNFQRDREGIFGSPSLCNQQRVTGNRARSYSAPAVTMCKDDPFFDDPTLTAAPDDHNNHTTTPIRSSTKSAASTCTSNTITKPIPDLVSPFTTEQDLARPKYENSPALLKNRKRVLIFADESTTTETAPTSIATSVPEDGGVGGGISGDERSVSFHHSTTNTTTASVVQIRSFQQLFLDDDQTRPTVTPPPPPPPPPMLSQSSSRRSISGNNNNNTNGSNGATPPPSQQQQPMISILERLLRQQDPNGNGISQAVLSELAISLWMMMDVANAWTSMALALLAANKDASMLVEEELNELVHMYTASNLFQPSVLNKMKYVDALLYEAIRLTPAFLAGLKKTTATIELKEVGVQLPKNTHIFFCQPTDTEFDIHKAYGRKPEMLGKRYPSVELHGFLPLQGLEVPLMVLQCKVFLVVLLQRYSPIMSKKRTFIRRVKAAIDSVVKNKHPHIQRHPSSLDSDNNTDNNSNSNHHSSDQQQHPHVRDVSVPLRRSGSRSRSQSPGASSSRIDLEQGGEIPSSPNTSFRLHFRHKRQPSDDTNTTTAMHLEVDKLFTKLPFPEPRRVISIRTREIIMEPSLE